MANVKEIQDRIKSIQDTMKITDVHDLIIQDEESKESAVRYRALFL